MATVSDFAPPSRFSIASKMCRESHGRTRSWATNTPVDTGPRPAQPAHLAAVIAGLTLP